ncbi:GNAT family N-acetyltransferase [Roseomonas elaeocarpi]|uniref:dATP pyrophosphohydrolase n=1 Tax=Roseomonas elaeocarpi TaxID=907779 RepID=A0ABV6JQP0_9PROT
MSTPQRTDDLVVERVEGHRALDRFIRLPFALHAGDPQWRPPLLTERRAALTPGRNPYFLHAEAVYWIVRRGGRDVGRISAQVDRLASPAIDGGRAGHFGMLACEDDPAAIEALLRTAERWLAERGCSRVSGPFNLQINEEMGLLVEGYDTPPMLMMPHDAPYLGGALEARGYAKDKDVYAYLLDTAAELPQAARRILSRGLPEGVVLRCGDLKNFRAEVERLVDIFNDAWSANWGFTPLTPEELDHMAKQLRPLIDARLIWFVEQQGQAVAFLVCLPNLNEAVRDLDGRLFPFGWAKLLWRLKMGRIRTARVPLMGVRKSAAQGVVGALIPFAMVNAVRDSARAIGFRTVELSWILEDNLPMRRMIEAMGADRYKTYRIYGKALPA